MQVNLGVATFVPKPHTPFQWEPQLNLEESRRRINRLKQLLPRQGFKMKWHDPEQSLLEGVFARGDRRLSLGVRWLVQAARKRSGKSMSEKLAAEFVDAMNGLGAAVKRREDTHKMAEANRAFSHFKW